MKEASPHVIYFRHPSNCARIRNAKPGVLIPILVVPESTPTAQPIEAIGRLIEGTKVFTVTVKAPENTLDTHEWNFEWLLKKIHDCHPPTEFKMREWCFAQPIAP